MFQNLFQETGFISEHPFNFVNKCILSYGTLLHLFINVMPLFWKCQKAVRQNIFLLYSPPLPVNKSLHCREKLPEKAKPWVILPEVQCPNARSYDHLHWGCDSWIIMCMYLSLDIGPISLTHVIVNTKQVCSQHGILWLRFECWEPGRWYLRELCHQQHYGTRGLHPVSLDLEQSRQKALACWDHDTRGRRLSQHNLYHTVRRSL